CLVKECAREPQIVAAFNRAYGAALQAPIVALLDGRWPTSVSAEEELQIGCFIVFVHDQIWRRLKRVQARMERALRMRWPGARLLLTYLAARPLTLAASLGRRGALRATRRSPCAGTVTRSGRYCAQHEPRSDAMRIFILVVCGVML